MKLKHCISIVISLLAVTGLACALGSSSSSNDEAADTALPKTVIADTAPMVTITNPTPDEQLTLDQTINIVSTVVDAQGVERVELIVNNQVVNTAQNPDPQPNAPFLANQPWQPDKVGNQVIQVRAYNPAGVAGESEQLFVEVIEAAQEEVSQAEDSASAPTATNTPSPALPTAQATPEPDTSEAASAPSLTTKTRSSLALREGPGTLFPKIETYPVGIPVTAVGRAAGDDWLKVVIADGTTGWMFTPFLELVGNDISMLPLVEDFEAVTLSGRVLDEAGHPVIGVNIAVIELANQNNRTDHYSDKDGFFYAYFPPGTQGSWYAAPAGLSCELNSNCQQTWSLSPESISVELPTTENLAFTFITSENQANTQAAAPANAPADIVIDNRDAGFTTTGEWFVGDGGQSYNGDCIWALPGLGNTAQVKPDLPFAGSYEIFVWGCGDPNHDQNFKTHVVIYDQENVPAVDVNLKENAGQWVSLGTYYIRPGTVVSLESNIDGNIVADAVKFVYKSADDITLAATPIPDRVVSSNNPPDPIQQLVSTDLARRLGVVQDPFYPDTPVVSTEPADLDDCQNFPREGCGGNRSGTWAQAEYHGAETISVPYLVSDDYQFVKVEQELPAGKLRERQTVYLYGQQGDIRFKVVRYPGGSWHLMGRDFQGASADMPLDEAMVATLNYFVDKYNSLGNIAHPIEVGNGLQIQFYGFGSQVALAEADRANFAAFTMQLVQYFQP